MRPSNIYDAFKSYLYAAPVVSGPIQAVPPVQVPPVPAVLPQQTPVPAPRPQNRYADEQLIADLYGEIRNLKYTLSHLLLRESPPQAVQAPPPPPLPLAQTQAAQTPQPLLAQTQPEPATLTTKLVLGVIFIFLLLIVVLLIVSCVYLSKSASAADHLKYTSLQRSYSLHHNKYVQPW